MGRWWVVVWAYVASIVWWGWYPTQDLRVGVGFPGCELKGHILHCNFMDISQVNCLSNVFLRGLWKEGLSLSCVCVPV